MGVIINEFDIAGLDRDEISGEHLKNDFIYIAGGNTSALSRTEKNKGGPIDKGHIGKGKIYIGISVLSIDISYVEHIDDRAKAAGLADLAALNVSPFYSLPQYKSMTYEDIMDKVFDLDMDCLFIIAISNRQTIELKGDEKRIAGHDRWKLLTV